MVTKYPFSSSDDPFRPKEDNADGIGSKVPYLIAIVALKYLDNCTRPNIIFVVILLARFSSCLTERHLKGIKQIFQYLRGLSDLGLFYSNNTNPIFPDFAIAGYLSDPLNAKSHTGYVFIYGDLKSKTLITTSLNHVEVVSLHEAIKECKWLRSLTRHIQGAFSLQTDKNPIILYEDNAACVTHMK